MTNWIFILAAVLGLALVLFMWAAIVTLWAVAGVAALYTGLLVERSCIDRKGRS